MNERNKSNNISLMQVEQHQFYEGARRFFVINFAILANIKIP